MRMRRDAGDSWKDLGLVFCTPQGSALDAANVRRSSRLVASSAGAQPQGMDPARVTPQFRVFTLKLWGDHRPDRTPSRRWKTSVTERVYRKELRPVITRGAHTINELFDGDTTHPNREQDQLWHGSGPGRFTSCRLAGG
jgi:hypothetical protein